MTAVRLKRAYHVDRPTTGPKQVVHIVVSRADPRRWCVRSSDDSFSGTFLQYDRALSFAQKEAAFLSNAIVIDETRRRHIKLAPPR